MSSDDLDQLVRAYLETKIGAPLDYFVIENRMSTDASGDIGMTGNYRKRGSDKNVYFTITVNLATRKIRNLQEY
jgi:hypothetical protein